MKYEQFKDCLKSFILSSTAILLIYQLGLSHGVPDYTGLWAVQFWLLFYSLSGISFGSLVMIELFFVERIMEKLEI